jgi:hypothetical protein
MKVQFLGYAPDADPTLPGVITDCNAWIPSFRGYQAAPSPQSTTVTSALADACRGAAVLRKLDESTRLFAGTSTKLYEASGSSWTDRTRASGGDYILASDHRWRFAQFGDVSLAAAKTDILQSSSSGAFANVGASAPKAAIVETIGQFVMLADVNDQGALAGYGDSPDRWWCSAKGDHTDWTPSTTTESTSGRLTSSPGKIRALRRFGERVIAYKHRSMFIGEYRGAPQVWSFTELPGQVGAPCQEVVVNVGTPEEPKHIFMGFDDFYEFDGSRAKPIGENWVKKAVFSTMNKAYAEQSSALHDVINSRVYFYYPVGSSVNPDRCVVYNYKTRKWGRDDRQVEAVVEYISPGLAYDDLGSRYSTYDDLPNLSYDSSFWTSEFPIPAIFNTSHQLRTLDGTPDTSTFTTGDMGDENVWTTISRIRPRFIVAPSTGSMVNYFRSNLGDALTTGATTFLSDGKFDLLREARWHRFRFDFTGSVETPGVDYTLLKGADE